MKARAKRRCFIGVNQSRPTAAQVPASSDDRHTLLSHHLFVIIIPATTTTTTTTIARKGCNCDALQLEGCPTSCQSFWALITLPIMCQPKNSTLPQPLLNSATPISSQLQIFWWLVGIYQYFWPLFSLPGAQTTVSELPHWDTFHQVWTRELTYQFLTNL